MERKTKMAAGAQDCQRGQPAGAGARMRPVPHHDGQHQADADVPRRQARVPLGGAEVPHTAALTVLANK